MEYKGFVSSLFDYSFSAFITPKVIKVLYILTTVLVALWTLAIVLAAFNASSTFGIFTLLIVGPIVFLLGMLYARVVLELLIVLFRIHGDVAEINVRGGGTAALAVPGPAAPDPSPVPAAGAAPAAATAVSAASTPDARYCDNCGAERTPEKRFCPACGVAFA